MRETLASATYEVSSVHAVEQLSALAPLSALTGTATDLPQEFAKDYARIWYCRRVAPREAADVVGYALTWHVADELQLVELATAPHCRRRGVATHLLDRLIAWAANAACTRLVLEVRSDNTAATALYRGAGFATGRRRPAYYRDGCDALELYHDHLEPWRAR